MAVAKRRAVDHLRRAETLRRRTAELGHALRETDVPDLDAAVDHIQDDVLRLVFITCHPALPAESLAALTLRLVADVMSVVYLIFNEGYSATAGDDWMRARTTPDGRTVLLEVQDRRLWDRSCSAGASTRSAALRSSAAHSARTCCRR